jgi:putative hemolysin
MNKKLINQTAGNISEPGNICVVNVMTKISEVTILETNDSSVILKDKIRKSKKTFYPVCDGCKDNIIGIIHVKEILINALSDVEIDLKEGLHEPVYFSENSGIYQVYDIFLQSNIGAAFIIDKGNNITGFITIKDIVKSFLGNLSYN